jgi:hypothetical protein
MQIEKICSTFSPLRHGETEGSSRNTFQHGETEAQGARRNIDIFQPLCFISIPSVLLVKGVMLPETYYYS